MEVQTDATDVKDVYSQKKQANRNAQKQKNRTVAIKSATKVLSVKNIFVPLHSQIRNGTLADRLGNGLQNRVEQFDSARYLTREGREILPSFFCFIPNNTKIILGKRNRILQIRLPKTKIVLKNQMLNFTCSTSKSASQAYPLSLRQGHSLVSIPTPCARKCRPLYQASFLLCAASTDQHHSTFQIPVCIS